MKKPINIFLLIILASVLFSVIYSFAEERITLTTYYPAPYGVYRELRASWMSIGSNYRNEPLDSNNDGWLIVEDRIGINTSSPDTKLEVVSEGAGPIARFTAPDGVNIIELSQSSSGDGMIDLRNATGNPAIRLDSSGNSYIMNNNLGIGTNTPDAKLDIEATGNNAELLRLTTERPWAFRQTGTGGNAFLNLYSTVTDKYFNITSSNGNSAADFLVSDTAANTRVYLVPEGGNVGIGTISPSAKFEVSGGNTYIDDYLRLKDYDGTTDYSQVISRDGNTMFYDGGVVVGQYNNNNLGNIGTGSLLVKDKICLEDSNFDMDEDCRPSWSDIIVLVNGNTGWIADDGGCQTRNITVGQADLKGRNKAVVFLRGWEFNYDTGDHHMDEIKLTYSAATIDPSVGQVSWTINACFNDDNNDDNFHWNSYYTIMAW